MPQLDRYLAAAVANRAQALQLTENDLATLLKDGVPRPITKQPLTGAQLLALLREIAPPEVGKQLEAGGSASFAYTSSDGAFAVRVGPQGGKWQATLTLSS